MNQPKRSLILHQLCCPVSNTREGKQRTNWVYLLWFLVKEIRQKACVSSPVELPFEAVIPINQLVSTNETMKSFDKRMKSPLLKAEAEVVEMRNLAAHFGHEIINQ